MVDFCYFKEQGDNPCGKEIAMTNDVNLNNRVTLLKFDHKFKLEKEYREIYYTDYLLIGN